MKIFPTLHHSSREGARELMIICILTKLKQHKLPTRKIQRPSLMAKSPTWTKMTILNKNSRYSDSTFVRRNFLNMCILHNPFLNHAFFFLVFLQLGLSSFGHPNQSDL